MDKSCSIIIPTYTGQDTLRNTLESVLNQKSKTKKELVIIIDGPNDYIRGVVNEYTKKISQKNFSLIVRQFKENKGRFVARLTGAKIASYNTLLFVDDRVTFDKSFLSDILKIQEDVVIPSAVEASDKNNVMSIAMGALRKVIYSSSGDKSDGYYITKANFDKSAKGTTTILVYKALFINACSKLERQNRTKDGSINKNISDDTKLLKTIIDNGTNIYKSNKLIINYHPRAGLIEEIKHTFNRGPKFIDYYFRPGTRYFIPLLLFIGLSCLWLVATAFFGLTFVGIFLIATLLLLLLGSIYLSKFKYKKILPIFFGLILLVAFFGLGLMDGLILKIKAIFFKNK